MSIDAIAFVKLRDLGEIETPSLRLLLLAVAENQHNDTRICRLTQAQFVRELRMGERTIRRHLATLEEHRIIIRAPKRNDAGHVEYDRIRIVGFTAWYRTKALPAKMAARRKHGGPTGQNGQQEATSLPAKNAGPTGQQVAGTYSPDSIPNNNPPNPPQAGGTEISDGLIEALRADGVAGLVVEHLFVPVLSRRRVGGLGTNPLETLRAIRHEARGLGLAALARAAQDVLDGAPVKVRADAIREAVRVAKTAGARHVIERGSKEWAAWMAHWQAHEPAKARIHANLVRTQVPTLFPRGATTEAANG